MDSSNTATALLRVPREAFASKVPLLNRSFGQTQFLTANMRSILSGMCLSGCQREIVQVMLEQCVEIGSLCFVTTAPQVLVLIEKERLSSSPDTVQRTLSRLETMGIATLQTAAKKGGFHRQAAVWRVDFKSLISDELQDMLVPQGAVVQDICTTTHSFNSSTVQTAERCATPSQDMDPSSEEADAAKWQKCLDLLATTGERVYPSALRTLASSGRSPDEAAKILTRALRKGKYLQSQGGGVTLVGYALSAVRLGSWGDDLLGNQRKPSRSMSNSPEVSRVQDSMAEMEWARTGSPVDADEALKSGWLNWIGLQKRLQEMGADHPAFLECHDSEREAFHGLLAVAEKSLGSRAEALRARVRNQLQEGGVLESSSVWKLVWEHHWALAVWREIGLPGQP